MRMRFPRLRAKNAGRSPDGQNGGTSPGDQADWSGAPALGDRACCCPARPVVRVLIPPASARPHPVDFLLCGHHYRASVPALAAAGAVIIADRRRGGTTVGEHQTDPLTPAGTTQWR
jgi:hypothetical protein